MNVYRPLYAIVLRYSSILSSEIFVRGIEESEFIVVSILIVDSKNIKIVLFRNERVCFVGSKYRHVPLA